MSLANERREEEEGRLRFLALSSPIGEGTHLLCSIGKILADLPRKSLEMVVLSNVHISLSEYLDKCLELALFC